MTNGGTSNKLVDGRALEFEGRLGDDGVFVHDSQ